ncbi:MAG TPA: tail fiber domain-containing protein, partial [Blastocatellia bacterium]|nr:tail fiber domain-containing protein [Blastocatellia bacterium]
PTIQRLNVSVTNGSFTLQLDFGLCLSCFNGANRYLEVSIRPSGASTFTTLSPRQPITSTPYAVRSLDSTTAASATTADGLSAACVNCITSNQIASVSGSAVTGAIPVASVPGGSASYIQNTASQQAASNFNISGNGVVGGMLGIGTSTPASLLHVRGANPVRILGDTSTLSGSESVDFFARSSIFGSDLGGIRIQRQPATGNIDTLIFAAPSGSSASEMMRVSGNGNVGIGTSSPIFKLQVVGGLAHFGSGAVASSLEVPTGGELNVSSGSFPDFGSRLKVTAGGNVGIGTPNPSRKLEVAGSALIYPGSGNGDLRVRNRSNSNASQLVFSDDADTYRGYLGYIGANAGLGTRNDTVEFGTNGKDLTFRPDETEVMRLTTSGTVVIGSSHHNPFFKFYVEGKAFIGENLVVDDNLTVGDFLDVHNYSSGSSPICVDPSGTISFCSSSLRYKTNLRPYIGGLDIIERLKPVAFTWKKGGMDDVGLGAEDVAEVEPLLIFRNEKGEIEGVKYDHLSVVFINAIKEQQAKINDQKELIERLQNQVAHDRKQISRQQEELEGLKRIVCASHPQAQVCVQR